MQAILLKKFKQEDYLLFAQVLKNPQVMANITGHAIGDEDIKKAWERVVNINSQNNDFGYYKIIANHHDVGYAKLVLQNEILAKPCLEFAYFLLPEFWGQGIGFEVGKQLIDIAKNHQLAIIATVSKNNIISKKLLSKLGLVFYQAIELDNAIGECWVLT